MIIKDIKISYDAKKGVIANVTVNSNGMDGSTTLTDLVDINKALKALSTTSKKKLSELIGKEVTFDSEFAKNFAFKDDTCEFIDLGKSKPVAKPTAKPTAKPAAKPTAKPAAKPAAKPTAKPAAKPATTPPKRTLKDRLNTLKSKITTTATTTKAKTKTKVKNLKPVAKTIGALGLAGVIFLAGHHAAGWFGGKTTNDNKEGKNDDNNRQRIEQQSNETQIPSREVREYTVNGVTFQTDGDVYEEQVQEEMGLYNDLGSIYDEDMNTQASIVTNGFYDSNIENPIYTHFSERVVERDQFAVQIVEECRYAALKSGDLKGFTDLAVNYIIGGGTNFGGVNIKDYNSLSNYSKFIVLTACQTMVPMDYNHITPYGNYDAVQVSREYDDRMDNVSIKLGLNQITR